MRRRPALDPQEREWSVQHAVRAAQRAACAHLSAYATPTNEKAMSSHFKRVGAETDLALPLLRVCQGALSGRRDPIRGQMKAARILRFGPPSVITIDDLPRPEPAAGQLLVRLKAAGVGKWDALFREGTAKLQPLPLTLGSELSGIVEESERTFRDSSLATRYTAQQTSNSAGHMRNTLCLLPKG
jgi:Alcohol dehydrogenase GroES-like domain